MSDVVTIIVNYRTPGLVIDCLRSLANQTTGAIIVVDNGSADDSVQRINDAITEFGWSSASVISLEQNNGYSTGNNVGIQQALERDPPPKYILLLNPDTVPRAGAVTALLNFFESHPKAGVVGSRLEDVDGTPQRSAFRFPSFSGELEGGIRFGPVSRWLNQSVVAPPVRNEPHVTDWVAGASMMIRREVIEQIGPMDEGYFLYFEEVDYCRRASLAGWECWYEPNSRVVHLVGQSTGVTDTKRQPARVPTYWFASRRRYFRKNHGRLYTLATDLAWASGFALWRIRRCLQRKPDTDPPHMLRDFVSFNLLGWRREGATA